MVTLICGKQKQEVTELKAQNILYIQKESGHGDWKLKANSPYQFKDNALIKRADTKDCKDQWKPKQSKGDSGGSKTPGEAKISRGVNTPQE